MSRDGHPPHIPHIEEDRLVLFHYGECSRSEVASIRAHLAGCERCAADYAALAATLGAVSEQQVPERPGDYGAQVWRRLERRISAERTAAPGGIRLLARLSGPRLALGATMALLLVVAFVAGIRVGGDGRGGISEPARARILLVTVGDHLERSERLLVELVNAGGADVPDLSLQKAMASRLAADNRLYRQTAGGAGEERIVELLEELERFLVEVANSPTAPSSAELLELKRRAAKRGLLLKIQLLGRDARERGRGAGAAANET
jgi:hypothetical protein